MSWVEVTGLEKEILLAVRKKNKSISEISEILSKSSPAVSQAVSRMVEDNLVSRNIDYEGDARYAKVSISKENIKVKKTHHFYFICFILSFLSIAVSSIISFFILSTGFLLGNLLGVIPIFFYMLYNAYVVEDKIIVEKYMKDKESISKKSS